MMKKGRPQRRRFLRAAAALGAASCVPRSLLSLLASPPANPIGYATISWRRRDFPHALEVISGLGFKGVQTLGWVSDAHRGDKVARLKDKLQALNLKPVALSCSEVRPSPVSTKDETGRFRSYAAFFQQLGGLYLQITDGGEPGNPYSADQIRSLAGRMEAFGRLAQDYGLILGYHPHFRTLGETREGLGRVLDAADPRWVKLIADVAHLTLGGADPTEVIRTYRDRLLFTHFKDVQREALALARRDRELLRRQGPYFCEIGTGAVDFVAVVRALQELGFGGWIIVELDEPGPGGPSESARANKQAIESLGLRV